MADDLLAPAAVAARGLFETGYIAALRKRPAGQPYGRERIYRLWSLLLAELWSRLYLDRRGAPLEHAPPAGALLGVGDAANHSDFRLAPTGTANG
jgi:hypothetical protein